jgi:serine/threonine protein kinase
VTEYHKQNYLVDSLEKISKLNERSVGWIVGQILMTLQYLRKMKVIHGSINLHSILLVNPETLEIKLADLGIENLLPPALL